MKRLTILIISAAALTISGHALAARCNGLVDCVKTTFGGSSSERVGTNYAYNGSNSNYNRQYYRDRRAYQRSRYQASRYQRNNARVQYNYRTRKPDYYNTQYNRYGNRKYNTQQRQAYQKKRYTKKTKAKRTYAYKAPNFASQRKATGRRVFIFDPKQTAWAAYESDGRLIRTGRASGGKGYCPDVRRACRTPAGSFKVYRKGTASCKSSKYPLGRGGAPMPHCMFFRGGYAVHGSNHVPNYNASHGCIRVQPSAAAWLSRNFMRHGTSVIVRPY